MAAIPARLARPRVAPTIENDYSLAELAASPQVTAKGARLSSSGMPELPLGYGRPLTLLEARAVMAAAERIAEIENWQVAIAIVDSTGHLVMLHKRDHAYYASISSALAKAETAINFRRSTDQFQDMVAAGAWRLLSVQGLTAIKGGIPLIAKGTVIGAIGVAGATADDDAKVALAGVAAISERLNKGAGEERATDVSN